MCTSIFVCGFDFSQKQMSSTLQQRFCTKFCVKSGFNGAQTLEMLEKCFDNDTLTRSTFSAGTNVSEVVVSRSRMTNAVAGRRRRKLMKTSTKSKGG